VPTIFSKLQVPNRAEAIVRADFTHQLINRDYIFQRYLAGELWDEVQEELSSECREALWAELATIARRIHNVKGHGNHTVKVIQMGSILGIEAI